MGRKPTHGNRVERTLGRHYFGQGDYWPRNSRNGQGHQRFGVMSVEGYPTDYSCGVPNPDKGWLTSFYVMDCDLGCAIVEEFSDFGRPGSHKVQRQREKACDLVDILNRREREATAA